MVRDLWQLALVGADRGNVFRLTDKVQRAQRFPDLLGSRIERCYFVARCDDSAQVFTDSSRNRPVMGERTSVVWPPDSILTMIPPWWITVPTALASVILPA